MERLKIRIHLLVFTYLLGMPSGRDALSCCRRDFRNGSTSCELSDPPDTSCNTQWSVDGRMMVDESGALDESRVHHAASQSILLRENLTPVIFWMDCDPPKNSLEVYCNDLCGSSEEFSPATEASEELRLKDTVNRSTSDAIFIFLSIIIFMFVT